MDMGFYHDIAAYTLAVIGGFAVGAIVGISTANALCWLAGKFYRMCKR